MKLIKILYCSVFYAININNVVISYPVRDENRLRQWLQNIGRPNWQPPEGHRVCSLHFASDCIFIHNDRKRLRDDAVPTVFGKRCIMSSPLSASASPVTSTCDKAATGASSLSAYQWHSSQRAVSLWSGRAIRTLPACCLTKWCSSGTEGWDEWWAVEPVSGNQISWWPHRSLSQHPGHMRNCWAKISGHAAQHAVRWYTSVFVVFCTHIWICINM